MNSPFKHFSLFQCWWYMYSGLKIPMRMFTRILYSFAFYPKSILRSVTDWNLGQNDLFCVSWAKSFKIQCGRQIHIFPLNSIFARFATSNQFSYFYLKFKNLSFAFFQNGQIYHKALRTSLDFFAFRRPLPLLVEHQMSDLLLYYSMNSYRLISVSKYWF